MDKESSNSIRIIRRFVEPPIKLWQAWTDPKLVRLWFGSDPNGVVLQAQMDVRVDGEFEITFANFNGTEHTCYGVYREVRPISKLFFSWSWKKTPNFEEMVSVLLQENQSGTLMTFEHSNIDPNTSHGYEVGWSTTFEKLERALKA